MKSSVQNESKIENNSPKKERPQSYIARFEDKLELNESYIDCSFELVKPYRLEFEAGQYISLKVDEEGLRRSYSLCNNPQVEHQIELLVDLSPGGPGSQFFKNLEFGQEVEFLAPLGDFVIPEDLPAEVNDLCFVATGSGIAPFNSIIENLLRHENDQRQITLHWGMRYAEDLFWLDKWQALTEAFDNFHFHPVLSQAPDKWSLCRGHVTDCLSVHSQPKNAAYFLCGGQAMIRDVTEILVELGVESNLIFNEKYF